MKIRRISLIEAGSPGFKMLNRFAMVRVGTVLLSTILKERGYEVRAFIEDISAPDWDFVESSDLLGISSLTPNAPRAYRIADRARAKGIPVVMGGVHPSFRPEEALGFSDFVIRGEGDYSLPLLVSHIEDGTPPAEGIPGLSFRDSRGSFRHIPQRGYLTEEELERLPIPDFSLVHKWKPSFIYPISTSRGCPFECRFCSVISMFGRRYRFKSLEAAMKELRHVNSFSKTATRIFVDDNFTANKARSKRLLRAMTAEGLRAPWVAQVRTDVASDPELLGLMADSGCHTLHIGFESINPRTLLEYNKKQALEDIVRCVEAVRDHGIHIHGMFVLGADTDDVDVIRRTADFAIKAGIDTAQFVALTPLPGTPFFDEMKSAGRLLHEDWEKYDLQHVVFRPALMSPRTLQVETLKGMGRFYSWKYIFKRLARLDVHYGAIGLYMRKMVGRTLKEVSPYLEGAGPGCALGGRGLPHMR